MADIPIKELSPLTPEIMAKQATINIGTIGHVAHGKSTVVKAITGVQTIRFRKELERNITIKLGYANAKIFKCDNPECPPPSCYKSFGSSMNTDPKCTREGCGGTMRLQRHVSFVDCPGHDVYMATMLNGAAVMDAALLLIAANETCPQPQTSEHLAAVEIMKLKHILILQNKIDLVRKDAAMEQYNAIRRFVDGTEAASAPIIPISAVLKYNIDVVCQYIVESIPIPPRDFTSAGRLIIIRSFDVNRPGISIDDLKGGVAGGSLMKGVLRVGDEIEIRPGIVRTDSSGKNKISPIYTTIVSLFAEQNSLDIAIPGGLIGVGTNIDPYLARSDYLVGRNLGHKGSLPPLYNEIEISYYLLKRLLGVKAHGKQAKVEGLKSKEILNVNIGSVSTSVSVISITTAKKGKKSQEGDVAKLSLAIPSCAEVGEKVALSRKIGNHFRLIGWGLILRGVEASMD